ncbi:hypothetical protein AAVH_05471 [Aphelenchoides avenae]|nr:hypothetical protein AAVH_05471 [Aphelenchus avenae]
MNNFVQRYSNELSKVDLGKLCLIGSTDGRVVKHIERALKHAACISLVLEFLVIDTGLISALADGLTSDVAELEIAQCYVNCSSSKLADQLHKWNVLDLVLKECTFLCPRNDALSPISDRLFQRNHQLRHVSCTYKHRAWSNLSDDTLCMWALKCSWPDNLNLCNFRSNITHYGIYVVAKAFVAHSLQFPANGSSLLWNLGTIESTPLQLRAQLEKLRRFVDITEETTTFTSLRIQATPSQALHMHVVFRKRASEVLNCSLNNSMFSVFSTVSKAVHV